MKNILMTMAVLCLAGCDESESNSQESENTQSRCSDGYDNDLDGRVDCKDPECTVWPVCATLISPTETFSPSDGDTESNSDADTKYVIDSESIIVSDTYDDTDNDTDSGEYRPTDILTETESNIKIDTYEDVPTWESDGDTDSDADTATETGSDWVDGGELVDPISLIGSAFEFKIENRDWVEPTNSVGDEIGQRIPVFAFEVVSVDGTTLNVVLGTVAEGDQMACNEAKTVEIDVSANPKFLLGPTDLQIVVEGPDDIAMTTILDFTIEGTIVRTDDGISLLGDFSAVMDISETAELFADLYPYRADRRPENICNTIANVAGEQKCFSCKSGNSEEYCTAMLANNIDGKRVDTGLEAHGANDDCLTII